VEIRDGDGVVALSFKLSQRDNSVEDVSKIPSRHSFSFEDIIKSHEFGLNLSFYKCNTQKRGESDRSKITELIWYSDRRDFRNIA
jgi:hypothetical protein